MQSHRLFWRTKICVFHEVCKIQVIHSHLQDLQSSVFIWHSTRLMYAGVCDNHGKSLSLLCPCSYIRKKLYFNIFTWLKWMFCVFSRPPPPDSHAPAPLPASNVIASIDPTFGSNDHSPAHSARSQASPSMSPPNTATRTPPTAGEEPYATWNQPDQNGPGTLHGMYTS